MREVDPKYRLTLQNKKKYGMWRMEIFISDQNQRIRWIQICQIYQTCVIYVMAGPRAPLPRERHTSFKVDGAKSKPPRSFIFPPHVKAAIIAFILQQQEPRRCREHFQQ